MNTKLFLLKDKKKRKAKAEITEWISQANIGSCKVISDNGHYPFQILFWMTQKIYIFPVDISDVLIARTRTVTIWERKMK